MRKDRRPNSSRVAFGLTRLEMNTNVSTDTQQSRRSRTAVLKAIRQGRLTPRSLTMTALTVAWVRVRWGLMLPGTPHICHLPPRLLLHGTVQVGRDLSTMAGMARPQVVVRRGAMLELGNHVFLNQGCIINCGRHICIGSNTMIGDYAVISDDDEHSVDGGPVRCQPIVIGQNVWIGRNALVMPGVTIGDNSVIGAGAVVTRDVPANSVAVGSPARVIRTLDIAPGWQRT